MLFAVGFAWLLLGQRLDPVQALGAALVVGGIALVRLDELRRPAAKPSEPLPEASRVLVAADAGTT